MPTYEYECDACGHAFERFQFIKAVPVKKCPSCGKKEVRRLIGRGAAVIFRGSGFYATDYRSADYHSKAKAEKDGSSGSQKSPGSKESGKKDS